MPTQKLLFPGLDRPVALTGAAPVADGLARVLRDWIPQPTVSRARPISMVRGRPGRGFDADSPWLDRPFRRLSVTSAVNSICADLCETWVDGRPDHLALHAASVMIGGRLVALAGTARTGKSTLAARLTAEPGMVLWGDDLLPLDAAGAGMAMGIAPRLRLPLPAAATAAFAAHVARHLALRDRRYGYLSAALVAPHGTRAPLSAFVALVREDGAPARLHRIAPAAAVARILHHNMGQPGGRGLLYDRAAALAASVDCLMLVYSELEEAVALLRAAFAPATGIGVPVGPPLAGGSADAAPPADPALVWRRAPGTALRRRGDLVWLWQAGDRAMFHLNPVAAAAWHLLARPHSAATIAAVLADAFPDVPEATIAADMAGLLGTLDAAGLVVPAGP